MSSTVLSEIPPSLMSKVFDSCVTCHTHAVSDHNLVTEALCILASAAIGTLTSYVHLLGAHLMACKSILHSHLLGCRDEFFSGTEEGWQHGRAGPGLTGIGCVSTPWGGEKAGPGRPWSQSPTNLLPNPRPASC